MEKYQGGTSVVLNTGYLSILRNGSKFWQQLDIYFQHKYIEQSIFALLNHFCTAYMYVSRALHACDETVTGWGADWSVLVCVCL